MDRLMRLVSSRAFVSLFMLGVTLALFVGQARATGDTAPTPFDVGVDVGAGTTAAATSSATSLGPIVGIALALAAFGALWMWAKRGIKSR